MKIFPLLRLAAPCCALLAQQLGPDDTLTKAMKLGLMFPDSRIAAGKFLTVTKLLIIVLSNAS